MKILEIVFNHQQLLKGWRSGRGESHLQLVLWFTAKKREIAVGLCQV